MKSVRLRIAAKLTLSIGLLSCLVGALIYCLICLPEVLNIPFQWEQLAIVAAVAVLVLIVTALLLLGSRSSETQEAAEKALLDAQTLADSATDKNAEADPLIEDCETQRKPLLSKKQAAVTKLVLQIALPVLIACVGGAVLANRAKKKEAKKNQKKKEKALKTLQELLED